MKTQTIRANEMTLQAFSGRPNPREQHVMKTRNSIASIVVLLATVLFACPGFAGNLIQNGSFETPVIPVATYVAYNSGSTLIPYWTIAGPKNVALVSGGFIGGYSFPAEDGNQWVDLTGSSHSGGESVSQTVSTIKGHWYQLSYWIGNATGYFSPISTVNVSINGVFSKECSGTNSLPSSNQLAWQPFTCTVQAQGSSTTLSFANGDDPLHDEINGLDNIVLTEVDPPAATWTPLVHQPCSAGQPCFTAGATLLLTDGRVLVHSEQASTSDWYTLTPDRYGDYSQGFWTKVASLPPGYSPLYFASAVLPDGRAIIAGGEYNNGVQVWINRVAIFNPLANGGLGDWKLLAPPPGWTTIGDAQSVVLPDGSFMLANCCSKDEAKLPAPYNPGITPWLPTGFSKADSNDEEGWTLLPSLGIDPPYDLVLTVDANVTNSNCPNGKTASEVYTTGIDDWYCPSNTPTQLWDTGSHELGPAVLRPDGLVFQSGAVPHTAFFNSATFKWTAGPDFTCTGCLTNLDIADGPAALVPNGNVLMMTSPGVFNTGAVFFELQFNSNTLVRVPGPPNSGVDSSYYGHMLVLPTGQILFTDFTSDVEIYTPSNQKVNHLWRPRVTRVNGQICSSLPDCVVHTNSTNKIEGFRFNGMSQGAAYGDDYQSATNYPLARLTESSVCSSGSCPAKVYYCRTHDHSSMGVATGNLGVSTSFDCPGVPGGEYLFEIVANGISQDSSILARVGP